MNSRKIFMVSTPTKKIGRITEELKLCDVVLDYFVPCPHCGEYQVSKFSQVKWPEVDKDNADRLRIAEREARYECERCRKKIGEEEKPGMLERGEWRGEGEDRWEWRSVRFRLSSLYSPWVKFGAMAAKFLESKPYPRAK